MRRRPGLWLWAAIACWAVSALLGYWPALDGAALALLGLGAGAAVCAQAAWARERTRAGGLLLALGRVRARQWQAWVPVLVLGMMALAFSVASPIQRAVFIAGGIVNLVSLCTSTEFRASGVFAHPAVVGWDEFVSHEWRDDEPLFGNLRLHRRRGGTLYLAVLERQKGAVEDILRQRLGT